MSSYRHISSGVNSTIEYVKARKEGRVKSLKTSFNKLNNNLLGGVDWGRIFTIAGQSGSGKTTIMEQIKKDFFDLNENDFEVLSFEFEMLVEDQLTRYAASRLDFSLKEIYSAKEALSDSGFAQVEKVLQEKSTQPLFYVDNPTTVDKIREIILTFASERDLLGTNKGLVVTIDHVLLTKGKDGQEEKAIIDSLMGMLNELKKYFAHIGLRSLFVCLAQLNREIEKMERVSNPMFHFPTRNDLFAASSIYHTSDYVLISHRPATIVGIGKGYGPPRNNFPDGYPLKYPNDPTRDMVYWHLIKERFGNTGVWALAEDFKHSRLEEVNIK